MQPKVITPASGLAVTVDDAKVWASIDHDDDDDLIEALIAVATAHFEGFKGVLGVSLIDTLWLESFLEFQSEIRLKNYPVKSIESITYLDPDGLEVVVDAHSYQLSDDSFGYYVIFSDGLDIKTSHDWLDYLKIRYVAGFGESTDIPSPIITAIKMYVAELYERREAQSERFELRCNPMIEGLINQYRRRSF